MMPMGSTLMEAEIARLTAERNEAVENWSLEAAAYRADLARLTAERDEWIQRADRAEARFAAARAALERLLFVRAWYEGNDEVAGQITATVVNDINSRGPIEKAVEHIVKDALSRLSTVEKR